MLFKRIWKSTVQTDRQATDHNTVMRIRKDAICMLATKATNTQSEYSMLIAFPRQQWLRDRASSLRYASNYCQFFGISCGLMAFTNILLCVCVCVCVCLCVCVCVCMCVCVCICVCVCVCV